MDNLKKKRIIFSIITLILFLVCVCGNFYTVDTYASRVYFSNSYNTSGQLYSGDVVEQEFTLAEEDEGVQVFFGTYVTVLEKGTIVAELFDENGEKVAETEVDLAGTQDNTYVSFHFGKLDESLYNQKCKIRLTFSNIEDQLLAYYTAWTDGETYTCTFNGEVQDHNLVVNGIKDTTYVEYRDFRLFYIFGIGVFAVYLAMFKIKWKEINVRKTIEKCKKYVKDNWKRILIVVGLILASTAVAAVAEYFFSKDEDYANPYRAFAVFAGVFLIIIMVYYKNYIWKRAHIFFFIVSMLVGSVYALGIPPTAVGWDEQLHYTRTAYMSWGATNKVSVCDYLINSRYTQANYYYIFLKDQREAWVEEANAFDAEGGIMGYMEGVQVSSIAYVPTSILLYVARVLGVDFITRFTLGRIFNLFQYSLFLAIAIKLLKGRGKMLIAAIGLIPTNIIMAASYGYDWWLISLIILGYAIFIGELQEKGRVSTKKFIQSVVVMSIGLMAKAVYFPLMLPLMLLKKDKYEDSKKARWIVVLAAVLLVASFILPLFLSASSGAAAGGGDTRASSSVNAAGQVVYILTNLGEYLQTLIKYMWSFLQPDSASGYLTNMAYQGKGSYYTVCLIIIGIAAAIDNSDKPVFRKRESLALCGGYIGVLGALVLTITSMYISYTAVGASSVSGCQPRYILPVLFPFLFFIGENEMKISDEVKGKVFSWCVVAMALIGLLAIHDCYIIKY